MARLPDGTNPYGRMLAIMEKATPEQKGIVLGEYLGGGKFSIGAHVFDRSEVLMIQHQFKIDDWTYKVPCLDEQKHSVIRKVTHFHYDNAGVPNREIDEYFWFDVEIPPLEKGDTVAAFQFGNEEYLILGRVVKG